MCAPTGYGPHPMAGARSTGSDPVCELACLLMDAALRLSDCAQTLDAACPGDIRLERFSASLAEAEAEYLSARADLIDYCRDGDISIDLLSP